LGASPAVSGFICSALQELTAHRFDSIHDQVQHHLPQLHAIAENRENVVRAQRPDRYPVSLPFLRDEGGALSAVICIKLPCSALAACAAEVFLVSTEWTASK